MQFNPHPYQRYAIRHLLDHKAAGLFLGVGMGKTIITLTAAAELLHDRFELSRVLVVAPKRVAETVWAEEAAKWDHTRHLRVVKVLGTKQQRASALRKQADIYVINHENLPWLIEAVGKHWPFDGLVLDEMSRFKSAKKWFRVLRRVRPQVRWVVGLTATPAPEGLLGLWPQVYLLDQGERLGKTLGAYRDRYFVPRPLYLGDRIVRDWIPKPEAEEAIKAKLRDLCIYMDPQDWLDLPERVDRTVDITLPDKVLRLYRDFERQHLLQIADGTITAGSAAVVVGKLLQMANGAVYDEDGTALHIHDVKLDALEELATSAGSDPLLVFYSYRHDLDRLRRRFPKARTIDEPGAIDDWNNRRVPMLLAHPQSAGHGLNLQAGGNHVVWFGLPWSLEQYMQANGRLHRQGQTQRVIVHHLVAKGTVDEDVMRALAGKHQSQQSILDAVKARLETILGQEVVA